MSSLFLKLPPKINPDGRSVRMLVNVDRAVYEYARIYKASNGTKKSAKEIIEGLIKDIVSKYVWQFWSVPEPIKALYAGSSPESSSGAVDPMPVFSANGLAVEMVLDVDRVVYEYLLYADLEPGSIRLDPNTEVSMLLSGAIAEIVRDLWQMPDEIARLYSNKNVSKEREGAF